MYSTFCFCHHSINSHEKFELQTFLPFLNLAPFIHPFISFFFRVLSLPESRCENPVKQARSDSKQHGLAFVKPERQHPVQVGSNCIGGSVQSKAPHESSQEGQESTTHDILSTLLLLFIGNFQATCGRRVDTILFVDVGNSTDNGSCKEQIRFKTTI